MYSRSRMMTIWLRTNRAIGSQPVMHIAMIIVMTLGRRIYEARMRTIEVGMLRITLYISVIKASSRLT